MTHASQSEADARGTAPAYIEPSVHDALLEESLRKYQEIWRMLAKAGEEDSGGGAREA